MHGVSAKFQQEIHNPLQNLVEATRDLRDVVNEVPVGADPTQKETLIKMVDKVVSTSWEVKQQGSKHKRELNNLTKRVASRLLKDANSGKRVAKAPASEKRAAAGKLKAVALSSWKQDFSEACKMLKDEGYKGSFCLKKGMPVDEKIQSIRRGRFLSERAANRAQGNREASSPSA